MDSNATKTAADPNTSGSFDLAWQEMLNVAVSKVYEAEKELTDSEIQHQTKMKACVALEAQLKALEKNLKSSIKKSRSELEYIIFLKYLKISFPRLRFRLSFQGVHFSRLNEYLLFQPIHEA